MEKFNGKMCPLSIDDADNAYSYMPDVSEKSSFVYGVESFKEQVKEAIPGVYGAAGGLLYETGKKLDKYFPDGIKLFNGAIDIKIGDELKSAGDTLINTANRQIEIFEEEYKKKNPRLEKAQENTAFDVGYQSLNWTFLLLAGSVGAAGKAMGGLVLSGEFKERAEKYKQEHGGSLEGFTEEYSDDAAYNVANAYVQGVEEKYLGSWAQVKSVKKGWGFVKAIGKNAVQEGFVEEPLQDVTDFYFDKVDGFNEDEELKDRLKNNLRGYVVASVFGGAGGFAGALAQRSQGIDMYEEALKNTVPEEDLENVATKAYEQDAKTLKDVVVVEIENSSSLRNRRGKVFENMYNATLQAIREAKAQGAYQELETEDDIASYAQAESERFADWTLAEATRRNTVLEEVIDAEKIAYKDGKIEIGMTEGTQEKTDIFEPIAERKTELPYDEIIHQLNTKEMSKEEEERLQEMLDEEKDRLKPLFDTALDVELEIEEDFDLVSELDDLSDSMLEDKVSYEDAKKKLYDFPEEQFEKLGDKIKERDGIDGNSAKIGYEYFTDKVFDKYNERVAESKNYRLLQESLDLANENARLDNIYPAYEGETITINGQEKTVYNSNGDRIAKSKEALENFYKWFGDSKVVDEQGRPLVVYHGTSMKFDTFRKMKGKVYNFLSEIEVERQGFFFTDNRDVAQNIGKIVMPVYLKSTNVFDLDSNYHSNFMKGFYKQLQDSQAEYLEYGASEAWEFFDGETGKAFTKYLQENGYDGATFEETPYEDAETIKTNVVFNPNQIKSTSNRGTYSESDNIYYQFEDIGRGIKYSKSFYDLKKLLSTMPKDEDIRIMYDSSKGYWFAGKSFDVIHNDMIQQAFKSGLYPEFRTSYDAQQYFDESTYNDENLYRFVAMSYENGDYKKAINNMGDDYSYAYIIPMNGDNGVVLFARGQDEIEEAGLTEIAKDATIYDVQYEKILSTPETYYQSAFAGSQGERSEKGSIEFRGDKALINLTEKADSTTLPHELAHYYLQNTFLYTKSGLASAEYMNNFNQIAKYLGITQDQENIKDWQQEKFARAYELYQMGNTPEGMDKPLTQYNQWLRKAYDGMQEPMYRDENGEMKVPEFDYDTMKMFASLAGETLTEPQFKENQERVRGLAKSTSEMAKQKGIETETPMYEPRSSTEMGKKADEFIKNNKQLAIDIVKGLAPEQDGLFRQDLFAALRELALNEGDSDLLNELSRSMTVEEATELGQRIQALARGTVDPVRQMTELRDERMKKEKVTKEKVKEETKKATKEIKKEIALAAQPKEWQDFIKSLEC